MPGLKSRFFLLIVMLVAASGWTVPGANAQQGSIIQQKLEDMQKFSIAYLRPGQIIQRLDEVPVVYVPIGPVEWHGPHMPFGTDPLIAETVALRVCRQTGGVVWPTLHWGSASLRSPEESKKLFGPKLDQYTWSVEFPDITLKSAYSSEEMLAMIVRETVREISMMNPKLILILSGHAAGAHIRTLERIALEENIKGGGPKVMVRGAWADTPVDSAREGGHACAGETSQMMYMTNSVALDALPALPAKIEYWSTGVVDDWSGSGTNGYTVNEVADPRTKSSVQFGEEITSRAVDDIVSQVKRTLAGLH